MDYQISNLRNHSVKDSTIYFLDANIWLKVLQPKVDAPEKDKKYRELFDKITANTKCKIAVPSLVLSEVINRILREVYLPKFAKKNKIHKNLITSDYYKTKFRPSDDFQRDYTLLCHEIHNYHNTIQLIDDGLGRDIKFKHILKDPPKGLDFNDFLYYYICKKRNYILITDDKDFWIDGIPIVTLSSTLIAKQIEENIKVQQAKKSN